ncbi:hypothetical protein [Rhodobacter maris]|uniref:Uncharacterized protein n=1 Tax=Rhodobacter maris TaxID=446682 RepID=A0A285SZ80_9RHOB|nr:hypothetical protein [Rhodobacter maris]SOC12155.1 hypothetical protein SAMN05877831_109132 [Rhodobacter maris]
MIPPVPQAAQACVASPRFAASGFAPPRFAQTSVVQTSAVHTHFTASEPNRRLWAWGLAGIGVAIVLAGFGLTAFAIWGWMRLLGLG